MPVSGIYEIKGVGYVFGGRLEKGAVKPGEKVVFLRAHHAQAVHPECLHSGNAPSVRRAGKPGWPRGPEHVEDNCRRQDTGTTFIIEITEVHVMFVRLHGLGGRDVRVTMVGRSEVLRLHGRTYARRGVFHSVLGGASRTQRFIVRTRRPTRMGENRAELSLKWISRCTEPRPAHRTAHTQ